MINFYKAKILSRNFLTNNGSNLFNVNGSTTPQIFTYQPAADEVFTGQLLHSFLTSDNNVNSVNRFVSISSGLSNGLLIKAVIDGNDIEICNCKNNYDLISQLNTKIDTKAIGPFTIVTGSRLLYELVLDGSKNDKIELTVRDNLSSLDQCSVAVSGKIEAFS